MKRATINWKLQHDLQSEHSEDAIFLYHDWIKPFTYESLCLGKNVLEAGSGGGVQTKLIAKYANKVTCVDLEAIEVTKKRTKDFSDKVKYVEGDLAEVSFKEKFDVVICVGVLHHTDVPEITFQNLTKQLKNNGIMVLWVYSKEGNFLMRTIIEPLRQLFLKNASHNLIWRLSLLINFLIYPFSHILYRIPVFHLLPYYDYFRNSRKMSFKRNALNIHDKLNAHQQVFIPKEDLLKWYNVNGYEDVQISNYAGVSWRISGKKL